MESISGTFSFIRSENNYLTTIYVVVYTQHSLCDEIKKNSMSGAFRMTKEVIITGK
jgi:hypothetical protein